MILVFDEELGKLRFEFIFVGFILGGSLLQTKGMTVLRREMALFEKLESISELKPCGKKMINGEPERQLTKPVELRIEPPEFDLLYNYMIQVPWQTGTPTRHALETIDWLLGENRK